MATLLALIEPELSGFPLLVRVSAGGLGGGFAAIGIELLRYRRARSLGLLCTVLGSAVVIAIALAAAFGWQAPSTGTEVAAGSDPLSDATITVGSKNYDEQMILGYIMVQALEAAGATVDDRVNLGGTEANRQALLSGQIDGYWEYTGTGWFNHLGRTSLIRYRQQQYEAVRDADLKQNSLVWMRPAPFNNTYAIAFRSEAAEQLGNPRSISDLGGLIDMQQDQATLCVDTQFGSRADGLSGLEQAYGFTFPDDNVATVDTSAIYGAIDSGERCNFGEVFTTDGRIAALNLTVLKDDEKFFPVYSAAPVFTRRVYESYGKALQACFDPIADALSQAAMTELNERVSVEGKRPQDVAQSFLEEENLLDNCR